MPKSEHQAPPSENVGIVFMTKGVAKITPMDETQDIFSERAKKVKQQLTI